MGAHFCEQKKIPRETVGHISSAGCTGQKEVAPIAHNNVFRNLMFDIVGHQNKTSAKDFNTVYGEDLELAMGKRGAQQYVQQERPVGGSAQDEARTPMEIEAPPPTEFPFSPRGELWRGVPAMSHPSKVGSQ